MRNQLKNLLRDNRKLDLYFYAIVMIAVVILLVVAHGIALYHYVNGPL